MTHVDPYAPDDADPALARVSATEPRLARDALRTIWLAFYDPDGDGPPYDPDGEVSGGDLVDRVGEVFARLRLVPPQPPPDGAEGAR